MTGTALDGKARAAPEIMKPDTKSSSRSGPLVGYRVVEIGGVGPTPFATMLLADLGADVVKIERPGGEPGVPRPRSSAEILLRGKRLYRAVTN